MKKSFVYKSEASKTNGIEIRAKKLLNIVYTSAMPTVSEHLMFSGTYNVMYFQKFNVRIQTMTGYKTQIPCFSTTAMFP